MQTTLAIRKIEIERQGQLVTDTLAVEEPLEIRVESLGLSARSVSITMRTPGRDKELAVGFLFTEGLIKERADVLAAEPCGPSGNVIKVSLAPNATIGLNRLQRHFYTTSSCGVCGKSSIEALKTQSPFNVVGKFTVEREVLLTLPDKLRAAQRTFDSTGGLHASGLFTPDGQLLDAKEDVGRHNALDKLIGHAFLARELPLERHVLMLSGRISFELVQKSAMAGIRFIAAIGAPSSLAVDLAKDLDITLVGFLRGENFNVYSAPERLV